MNIHPNHAGLQFRRGTGRMISSNISVDLLIESHQRSIEVMDEPTFQDDFKHL